MADRFDVEEGQEVVRNTIVGGRPRARRKRKIAIPIGLEKVLTKAAGDPAFRRRLFEDRRAALAGLGWALQTSEAVILGAVPDAVLTVMIDRIDLKQHAKRRFMKGIATAVFATAAMTSGVACTDEGDIGTKGIGPDVEDIYPGVGSDTRFDAVEPAEVEIYDGRDITKGETADWPDIDEGDVALMGDAPDMPEVDDIYPDIGTDPGRPEAIDAEEVFPVGILDDAPEVIDVTDDQPAVGGIMPDGSNE